MNAAEFFRLVLKEKQNIRCLALHSQLEDGFAKLLLLHPLTEKEEKMWNKLDNRKKLGLLSRKLIRAAKKVGIPQSMIQYYIRCKKVYKYHKNSSYPRDESFDIDEAIKTAYRYGKSDTYKELQIRELWVFTQLMLKSVIDKSDKQIKELQNK